jgi:RNA polymerase sigma-70 factor (ECF subfamily)
VQAFARKIFLFFVINSASFRLLYCGNKHFAEKLMQMTDWEEIVNKYGPVVWQTAYRLLDNHTDTADCFQETFICALEISKSQRVRSFPALLARIATSRAIDRLRQRFSQQSRGADGIDVVVLPGSDPGPEQLAQTQELAIRLRKALSRLQPKEAEVICLRCFNDMSYRQIGKVLGIKANTAGVLLNRARTKLRNILKLPEEE